MKPRQQRLAPADGQGVSRRHRPDYGLFVIASILLSVGLIVMYAISPALAALGGDVNDNYFVLRQFVAVMVGIVAFILASKIPFNKWHKYQKIFIVLTIIVSLGTLFTGAGAIDIGNRWIEVGPFSFQPVEMVKLMVVITFAGFLAKRSEEGNLLDRQAWTAPAIIAFLISFIVVVLQRDLGSSAVIFAILISIAYMSGFPMKKILMAGIVVVILATLAIMSTPYRRDRVATFMNPAQDCENEGYHACQALIAVGSGGVFGVGLGKSIQAYGYLPESQNDSIFAIYAEKFGFIGSLFLIGALGSLLLRILNIMQRAPNREMMLITAGIFTWFAVQGTINIAAMLGLMPLKGITLPFVSYGGSSLIFSMIALGIVFNISRYTTLRKVVHELPVQQERAKDEDNRNWRRDSRPRYSFTRRSF